VSGGRAVWLVRRSMYCFRQATICALDAVFHHRAESYGAMRKK
jgi:hypothetical protein